MKDNKVNKIFTFLLACVMLLSAAAVYPTTVAATTFNSGDSTSEVELEAPHITGVNPSEPDAFPFRQWLAILGSGFTGKSEVILRTGTEEYRIPAERTLLVSGSRIDVFVGLAKGAWIAQVINPDQPPSDEFTFNVVPHEGPIVASVHIDLLSYLDELIPDAGETEYFNDEDWDITREQYRIMIATLMWAEGAIHGYSAHSRAATDSVKHQDLGDSFQFSTGIGPMQLDRGGDPEWHTWPTIEKLDYKKALESTLVVHHDKMESITSLDNMRSQMKNTWFAYYLSDEWSPPRGHWEDTWSDITGLNWSEVEDCDKECVLDITWEEVKDALSANAEKTWPEHEEVVQNLGYKRWTVDYTRDSGEEITIDGPFETYLITARSLIYPVRYYYMNHATQSIEVWAYCNPDSAHHLRSIFVRDYSPERGYPHAAYPIEAGETLDKPALDPERDLFVSVDLVLVLDRSGSMSGADIQGARNAAVAVVDMLMPHDRVAVVSFASDATTNVHLTSDFEDAKTEIQKISAGGMTSFGAGLELALEELEDHGSEDHAPAIIFMSDGYHNTSPAPDSYVQECKDKEPPIPIYTIGFGSYPGDVDEARLKGMAEATGGHYLFAPSIYEMENVFLMFSLEATGWPLVGEFIGTVAEGDTVEAGIFDVEPNTDYVRITMNWPGSDLDLVIERPDGSQVDLGTGADNIYSGDDAKPEWAILTDPEPGTWKVKVYGKVINPHEDYIVWISNYVPPAPPVIEVSVDIRPGGWPNPINIGSRGVFSVAICGTEAFDVTAINASAVEIYVEGVEEGVSPIRWSYEDVATPYTGEPGSGHDLEGNGYVDLVLHFDTQAVATGLGLDGHAGETIPLIIAGSLYEELGGTRIEGQDFVWLLERGR